MKNLVNGYWKCNLGDDIMLKSLCDAFPSDEFYVLSDSKYLLNNEIENLRVLGNNNCIAKFVRRVVDKISYLTKTIVPFSTNWTLIKMVKKYDAYIELGGSIFMFQDETMDFMYPVRERILKESKKYYVIGSNFGPYKNQMQVEKYGKIFEKMDGVMFRDHYSANLFQDISCNIQSAPDVAFNYDITSVKNITNDISYVAISVVNPCRKSIVGTKSYVRYLVRQITEIIEESQKVVLMSFCNVEGDMDIIKEIYSRFSKKQQEMITMYDYRKISDTVEVLARAEKIIASRYHCMILGWLLKKPTFVICYSDKMVHVIKELYPEQSYVYIDSLNNDKIEYTLIDDRIENIVDEARKQFMYYKERC